MRTGKRATCLSLALLAALRGTVEARAQAVEMTVDGTQQGTPLNPVWSYFGYDEVNNTTAPESKDLLEAITAMMSTEVRVRTHFLLNSISGPEGLKWGATGVYKEDASGQPVYDWTVMDQVMDAVTATGARPYAEIAFMPQALTSGTGAYRNSKYDALDGGLFYPPRADAYAKWANLIRAWTEHTQARYADSPTSWSWELWNEPNIGYWHGTAAEFHKLYDYTELALHEVFPLAELGGPETAGVGADFLSAFLKHCDSETNYATGKVGTRLDLVSFHAKGGVDISNDHVRMNLGNQLAQHQTGFKIVAGSAKFKATPIIIGEADPDGCAACSAPPANAYRTKAAYGVYELAMMKHSQTLADELDVKLRGIVTWAWMFKDLAFFANFRQLQTNGVHLPVLNGFKLLGALKGNALPVTSTGALGAGAIAKSGVRAAPDIDAMAAHRDGQIQAIVWNYHDDLIAAPDAQISLHIRLPASFGSSVSVTRRGFDEKNGSSTAKWIELGRPATPSPTELATLKAASELVTFEAAHAVAVTNGEITLAFAQPRSGASLILVDAEKPTAPSGDAGSGGQPPTGGAEGVGGSAGAIGGGGVAGGGGANAGGTPANRGGTDPSAGGVPAIGLGGRSPIIASSSEPGGCGCRTSAASDRDIASRCLSVVLLVLGIAFRRARCTRSAKSTSQRR